MSGPSWTEGAVDPSGEHIRLCFGDAWTPVALVAPVGGKEFTVEFLVHAGSGEDAALALGEARRQLDYYLVELQEADPWAYALYHCGTSSNLYSLIRWQHSMPTEPTAEEPTT